MKGEVVNFLGRLFRATEQFLEVVRLELNTDIEFRGRANALEHFVYSLDAIIDKWAGYFNEDINMSLGCFGCHMKEVDHIRNRGT